VREPDGTGSAAMRSPESGLGVWSTKPLTGITELSGTYWPAVEVTFATAHGPVRIIAGHAVHPSLSDTTTWSSDLRTLAAAGRASNKPTIVMANLNATPWNAQFRGLASGRLHDAADLLGEGLRPTWPNWSMVPFMPLDHALIGGRLKVTSVAVQSIRDTDHRALTVTVAVPGNVAS
jgi:endonuclease/exonuclease/phosphatase (EEP) superfamily protein YafD